ncbi:MAG TPA: AMP-binding protein [Dermatophilaceae bacterium]|nr:AMP-binding protein [Dermatophilaceae bacterium]
MPARAGRAVLPVPVAPGADARSLLPRLRDALAGRGPALAPYAAGSPPPAHLAEALVPEQVAVLLATSGSTGAPRWVLLTAENLLASAEATHERLGGPGRWALALPVDHVAGLQVLVRSVLAGLEPATELGDGRARYAALVPTQLHRLLDHSDQARALQRYDAVLVGGAAASPTLLDRARAAGIAVVTTYGMTETAGGCVYDGLPLTGTQVRLDDEVIVLGGPTVALGYLDHPFPRQGGTAWFRTSDLGHLEGDRLVVRGRADDVIVTGGLKVAPARVEQAILRHLPCVSEALVVGIPDPRWGHAVAAVLVTSRPLDAAAVRQALRGLVADHELPRAVVTAAGIPSLGPGKPDRQRARDLFETQPT